MERKLNAIMAEAPSAKDIFDVRIAFIWHEHGLVPCFVDDM